MDFYSNCFTQYTMMNGQPEGKFIFHYDGGIKEEGTFKNGQVHGKTRKTEVKTGRFIS